MFRWRRSGRLEHAQPGPVCVHSDANGINRGRDRRQSTQCRTRCHEMLAMASETKSPVSCVVLKNGSDSVARSATHLQIGVKPDPGAGSRSRFDPRPPTSAHVHPTNLRTCLISPTTAAWGSRIEEEVPIKSILYRTDRYSLRTVNREGAMTSEYLPPNSPNSPDSGDRRRVQKTHLACHQFDYTCETIATAFAAPVDVTNGTSLSGNRSMTRV